VTSTEKDRKWIAGRHPPSPSVNGGKFKKNFTVFYRKCFSILISALSFSALIGRELAASLPRNICIQALAAGFHVTGLEVVGRRGGGEGVELTNIKRIRKGRRPTLRLAIQSK
jgi:hypothetical protein